MNKIVLAVGIILLTGLTLVRGADPEPVSALREFYFDYVQRLKPREYTELPVRVVDIDEASLAQLGQWPWPRDRLAQLVHRLSDYGAAVIVFDVLFAEPDRMSPAALAKHLIEMDMVISEAGLDQLKTVDTDQIFAQAISTNPVVLGVARAARVGGAPDPAKSGFAEIGAQPSLGLANLGSTSPLLPELYAAASGVGSISVNPVGQTELIRKVPLIWQSETGLQPGLALEALRLALGESTVILVGLPDVLGYVERLRIGDLDIPTTPDGQLWIRYRLDHPDLYVSAAKVLADTTDPALTKALSGNIVLIGTSAAGLLDIRTTALGQGVPGVSIHAQVIEQILLGDYLIRDDLIVALEIFAFIVLGLIVLAVMAWTGAPVLSMLTGAILGASVLGGSWYAFANFGVLFDATFPVIGGFMAFSGIAAYQYIVADRDKRMIRSTFAHYVAPSILDQIERSGHTLGLGGVDRTVTVMFCDIRNFTPLSETMSAPELVTLLNELFTELGAQILAENGTIDKFIGDAIMAFWNAPVESEHHRSHAASAALKMRTALEKFNINDDRAPISTAIGISSGLACVGNIGSKERFNYSVVGDTVNVAARIETSCRYVGYDILLSDTAADGGVAEMAVLEAGELALKGKSERTNSFALVGDRALAETQGFATLKVAHNALIDDIRSGSRPDPAQIAHCRLLAQSVEPGLTTFYDRISERAEDFRALDRTQTKVGAL